MVELGRIVIRIDEIGENKVINLFELRDIIKKGMGEGIGIDDIISISETDTKVVVYFKMPT